MIELRKKTHKNAKKDKCHKIIMRVFLFCHRCEGESEPHVDSSTLVYLQNNRTTVFIVAFIHNVDCSVSWVSMNANKTKMERKEKPVREMRRKCFFVLLFRDIHFKWRFHLFFVAGNYHRNAEKIENVIEKEIEFVRSTIMTNCPISTAWKSYQMHRNLQHFPLFEPSSWSPNQSHNHFSTFLKTIRSSNVIKPLSNRILTPKLTVCWAILLKNKFPFQFHRFTIFKMHFL